MGIVKRDSITITILSYVGVVIGYVNKVLLFPNFLSTEQVGLTTILISLATLYAQFSAFGINSTVVKFFPFFKTPDKRHNGLFFWSALGVSTGFVLFTLLFLLFREPVMAYFSQKSPLLSEYYLLLIPLGLATLFFNFFSAWLQALYKNVLSSFVNDVLVRLLITLEISLFALGLIDFEQFVIGYVLIYFVPTLVLLVYIGFIRQAHFRPVLSMRTRKLISVATVYGLWQYMGATSLNIVPVIDQTMLAGMNGLAESGIFGTMVYIVSVILLPHRSMVKVTTPIVADLWKERDMTGLQKISRSVSQINLIAGCFIFTVIWINLGNIFSLMPEDYSAGRYIFLFLGLGRIVDMYMGLSGTVLVNSKKFRYDFLFSLVLVGLTVATNALLIPVLGMTGAALATMTTVVLYNTGRAFLVWRFFRIQPFAWSDLLIAGIMGGSIAVSALIPALGNFIVDGVVRTTLIALIFGAAVYFSRLSPEINRTLRETASKFGIRLPE